MDARDIGLLIAAGAVAGNVTATGIQFGDGLMAVIDMTTRADLVAEFTVTADDTINNIGGTSTNGHNVLVLFHRKWHLRSKFEENAGPTAPPIYPKGRSSF